MNNPDPQTYEKVHRLVTHVVSEIVGPKEDILFVFYRGAFCSDKTLMQVNKDCINQGEIALGVLQTTLQNPGVIDPVTMLPCKKFTVATVPLVDGWMSVIYGHPAPGQFSVHFVSDEDVKAATSSNPTA